MCTRCLSGSGFDLGRSRFWSIDNCVIFSVNVVGVFFKTRVAAVRVRRIVDLAIYGRCVVCNRVGRAPICYFTALRSIGYHDIVLAIEPMDLIGLSSSSVRPSLSGIVRMFALLFNNTGVRLNAID